MGILCIGRFPLIGTKLRSIFSIGQFFLLYPPPLYPPPFSYSSVACHRKKLGENYKTTKMPSSVSSHGSRVSAAGSTNVHGAGIWERLSKKYKTSFFSLLVTLVKDSES